MKNKRTLELETLLVSELDQWYRRNFCDLARGMITKSENDPKDWATYSINPMLIGFPVSMDIWVKDTPMAAAVYLTDLGALHVIANHLSFKMAGTFISAMHDFTTYFSHLTPKYRVTTSEHESNLNRVSMLLIFQSVRTLAVRLTFQLPYGETA